MSVILVGRKKFHSKEKNQDYFQYQIIYNKSKEEGMWCDSPFISEECYNKCNPSDFGQHVELDYGYEQGRRFPVIKGYHVIPKEDKK